MPKALSAYTAKTDLKQLFLDKLTGFLSSHHKFSRDKFAEIDRFIRKLTDLWQAMEEKLPSAILELVVVLNRDDFDKTIFICEDYAKNPRSPGSYDALLRGTDSDRYDDHYQVRILAPHIDQLDRVKMLRFTPDACKPILDEYKRTVSGFINELIVGVDLSSG